VYVFLGRAHLSHPAKHVLVWAVGGGWPLSQAQHWVANKTLAELGSPSAGRQTPDGGRPWIGLTRPGPIRLARPAATTLTNAPLVASVRPPAARAPFFQKYMVCKKIAKLYIWHRGDGGSDLPLWATAVEVQSIFKNL
jgi:hypothetical protein